MNSSSSVVFTAIAALLMLALFLAPASEAAISCSDVIKDLRPCLSYLQKGNGMPPAACCSGASALAAAAATTADKRTACGCLKSASQQINPNPQVAKALPGLCGISLPYPISPSVDCSKIN